VQWAGVLVWGNGGAAQHGGCPCRLVVVGGGGSVVRACAQSCGVCKVCNAWGGNPKPCPSHNLVDVPYATCGLGWGNGFKVGLAGVVDSGVPPGAPGKWNARGWNAQVAWWHVLR